MRNRIWRRICALALAVCVACVGVAFAEAVDADRGTIAKVQQALNDAGYDCGAADGVIGKRTIAAIEQYQAEFGLSETGTITGELLESMGIELPPAGEDEWTGDDGWTGEDGWAEIPPPDADAYAETEIAAPLHGPVYASEFDYEALMRNSNEYWNLRVKVSGTADDLSGSYPLDQQRANGEILLLGQGGEHYLACCDRAAAEVPDYQTGDLLTVCGKPEGSSGDESIASDALCLRADLVALGDAAAPNCALIEKQLERMGGNSPFLSALGGQGASSAAPLYNLSYDTAAVADADLASAVEGELYVAEAKLESGWVRLASGREELGAPAPLINFATGMSVYGCRGADAWICDDGILQFEWRDSASGARAEVEEVANSASDGSRSFQLYARRFDFDGNLLEERPLSEFREDGEFDLDAVDQAMAPVCEEFGAHCELAGNSAAAGQELSFAAVDGDAVAFGPGGSEILRYPCAEPEELHAALLPDLGVASVAYEGTNGPRTELFLLYGNDDRPVPYLALDESLSVTRLTERDMPLSMREAMGGGAEAPELRVVGKVVDLDGNYKKDVQLNWEFIPIESEAGATYFIQYGGTGVEVPDYKVGDTLSVIGSREWIQSFMTDNVESISKSEVINVVSVYKGLAVVPSHIGAGDEFASEG